MVGDETPERRAPRRDGDDEGFVNVFGSAIERDGRDWCVVALLDGERRVVSRHATEEQARQASAELNASGNRDPSDRHP